MPKTSVLSAPGCAVLVSATMVLLGCGDDKSGDTGIVSASAATVSTTNTTPATSVTSTSASGTDTDDPTSSGSGSASDSASSSTTGGPGSTSTTATSDVITVTDSSSDSEPVTSSSTGTGGNKFDVGVMPDIEPQECINCALTIASMQSGTLAVLNANVFATAELQGEIVYAMGKAGAGRFIATADTSLPFNEVSNCPIIPWLSDSAQPNPTLFWFGWGPGDGPKQWNYPGMSAGIHLPAQYIGNPAQLRAEFDMILYLEGSGQFDGGDAPSDAEMQTIVDYVTIHGGGLYVSSEFLGYLNNADYASVNRLMKPLGVEALAVNLDWGNVDGQIDFECFPPPPQ